MRHEVLHALFVDDPSEYDPSKDKHTLVMTNRGQVLRGRVSYTPWWSMLLHVCFGCKLVWRQRVIRPKRTPTTEKPSLF